MTTKLELVQATYNRANKDFKFVLDDNTTSPLTLYNAPDGFVDTASTKYARHKKYRTVLRKTSKNELQFFKEGRDYIKNIYDNYGIDGQIIMTVYRYDKATQAYVEFPTANKVDLSTYVETDIAVSVQMIDTQFNEKVLNRDTSEVDLLKLKTIDGTTLTAFTNQQFKVPDTSILLEADFSENGSGFLGDLTHTVPILEGGGSGFAETFTPSYLVADVGTEAGGFFQDADQPRILSINVIIEATYLDAPGGTLNVFIRRIDSAGATLEDTGIGTVSSDTTSFSFNTTREITVYPGESLCLIGVISTTSNRFEYSPSTALTITETYEGTPEKDVIGLPFYEALLRNLQIISDTLNPLQSNFFGRTDSAGTTYASDGAGSLGFLTRGIFYRLTRNIINTIPTSFDNLFQSLSAIWPLGMAIQEVGGVWKCVIEDLDTFLESTVILDLSDRISDADIERSVIPEDHYKTAQHGYKKAETDSQSGLMEFNTTSVWTTEIESSKTDLKKISNIRADTQGIRKVINAPFQVDDNGDPDYDPTKDVKGDEDLFFNNVVRDTPSGFLVRTNEDFTSIGGSIYADASFNIFYSPARNLRRWGDHIRAGLLNYGTRHVRWQTTDKNSTLTSQTTSETTVVDEDADIQVSNLKAPRFLNEEYKVTAPITTTELNNIDANRNQLIKLTATKYGWINEFTPNTNDQEAEFILWACNLDVVTPSI